MSDNLKEKTISGLFWQFSQKILLQLITFSVSVVLARMLMPEDYGIIAICGMVMVLFGIFIDGGLGISLVQKKDVDELDFSTAFYTSLILSLIGVIAVCLLSPYFASFFNNNHITSVLRVLALAMPIGSLAIVQTAFVRRQMLFRKFFVSSLLGTILSAAVGFYMAFFGYGVWALVGQHLTSSIVNTITLYFIVDWHPKLIFSFDRLKEMFSFGAKMTIINFITTLAYQLKGYIIGLKYSVSDLAYYNRGEGLPGILYNNINGTISSVLFPALARLQDDKIALRNALRRSIRTSCFILMPMMFGLAAISDNLVIIIFTEKWIEAIPYMQVICFISCSDILGLANYQALQALGHAGTLIKLEFLKRPLMLLILAITMFISPLAIAVGQLVYSIFAFLINSFPNIKYIDYSFKDQIKDVSVTFIISLIMMIFVYVLGGITKNIYIDTTIQVIAGCIIYILLSKQFNKGELLYIADIFKDKILSKIYNP